MSRLRDIQVDPHDLRSVAEALTEVIRILDSQVEFGNPQDPRSRSSVELAGDAAAAPSTHNGQLMNIRGSWVELEFTALDTEFVAHHNLGAPIFNSEVNVRWITMGIRHDGNTVSGGVDTFSVLHEDGGTLTTNTIGLRAYAAATRVVDADHPLHVSLFFIKANRWPG